MKPRPAAFTFVEVLAALAFLGILVPVIVSALMLAGRAGETSERMTVAAQLAENELSQLMIANAWQATPSRGDFGPQFTGYRWEFSEADWQAGSMSQLTVTVYFQVQGKEHSVSLSTLANASAAQAAATQ